MIMIMMEMEMVDVSLVATVSLSFMLPTTHILLHIPSSSQCVTYVGSFVHHSYE